MKMTSPGVGVELTTSTPFLRGSGLKSRSRGRLFFFNFKIMHPAVLNYEIMSKQTTIERNNIKYSHNYMFR
jgi:hypothetical protein